MTPATRPVSAIDGGHAREIALAARRGPRDMGVSAATVAASAIGTMTWRTRQIGQIQHAVDHRLLLGRQVGGGFLHDEAQFVPAAEEAAGVGRAAGPMQQAAREPGHHGDQRGEQPVNPAEGHGQGQREAVGIALEKRLGRQFADDVKDKHARDKHRPPSTRGRPSAASCAIG